MKKQNNAKSITIISVGAALLLAVSLIEGFVNAAANAFNHLIEDVTSGLLVHVYIAGAILAVFGLYSYVRRH